MSQTQATITPPPQAQNYGVSDRRTEPEAKGPARETGTPRTPKDGDRVNFWPPHQSRDIGPAEKPLYAIVADVKIVADIKPKQGGIAIDDFDGEQERPKGEQPGVYCTLAVLTKIGTWATKPGVRFSEVPKTGCWNWPR